MCAFERSEKGMEFNMKREKSCGCIILNDKNEILLVLQTAGHWGLPKGHVEEGETEEQTAIREVKEETNVDVIVNTNLRYSMVYSPKEDVEKEVVYFIAKNTSNDCKPQLEEVQEMKWLDIDNAIDTITYENSKDLLRKVKKDLNL